MKITAHFKNTFLAQWLAHALLLWATINGSQLLYYYIEILQNGYFIFYEDGRPMTVWDRFYQHNINEPLWVYFVIFTLFVELLRWWGYERKTFVTFMALTALAGAGFVAFIGVFEQVILENDWRLLSYPMPWIVFVIYAVVYIVLREFIRQKLYRKEVRLARSEAQLQSLRAQINPHFFFNTFNYIYGTALREQAHQTARSMEMMSAMMRYSMSVVDEGEVPLSEELAFMGHYIELQKIRIAQKEAIRIQVSLPQLQDQTLLVAPMLFITLVENAFKYGISIDHPSFITIMIKVSGGVLTASVENSRHEQLTTESGMGSGLKNMESRLQLLYPGRHTFTITQSATTFSVHLKITTRS